MKKTSLFLIVTLVASFFLSCNKHAYVVKKISPERVSCLTKIETTNGEIYYAPSESVVNLKVESYFDFNTEAKDAGNHFFDCTPMLKTVLDSGYLKARVINSEIITTTNGEFLHRYICEPLTVYSPCFCRELVFYSESFFAVDSVVKFRVLVHGPDDYFITGFEYLSSPAAKKDSIAVKKVFSLKKTKPGRDVVYWRKRAKKAESEIKELRQRKIWVRPFARPGGSEYQNKGCQMDSIPKK